jgi:hypothetical protein
MCCHAGRVQQQPRVEKGCGPENSSSNMHSVGESLNNEVDRRVDVVGADVGQVVKRALPVPIADLAHVKSARASK